MAKGTALKLKYGADESAIIKVVRDKFRDKRATAAGWHGCAVVNVEAGPDAGQDACTYIVKGIKNGFELYALAGRIVDKVTTKAGTFQKA